MTAKIEKTINGLHVAANPVFKGGILPSYWACSINDRIIPKTFGTAAEAFRFAKKLKHH